MTLTLSACVSSDEVLVYTELSFSKLEPIALGAASVSLEEQAKLSRQSPNVEHLSPVSFEEAIAAWSRARFLPNGVGTTRIRIIIERGTIIERPLDVDGGLRGMLKVEKETEYEARIKVAVVAEDSDGRERARVGAEVWKLRTVPEGISAFEKQKVLLEMVEATVLALDQKLVTELRSYFSDYVM